ncbi:PE-PGRS family protein [Kitasatospora sp. MBT66]|uniref:PE-PGRS family protein n=1 Tax=Kitasatospora sp. MBT66 TaxID=1444769 RepID=UPI000ACCCA38|nr:PE-PGRS family protein [Kitasatospora sp. MBT66]
MTVTDVTPTDGEAPLADCWARVLRPEGVTGALRERWRNGALLNPAAPPELRVRVMTELEEEDPLLNHLTCEPLPEALVDAWIAHPSARVRARAAERTDLTGAQRQRLLRDASTGVRLLVLHSGGPDLALDAADVDRLVADPSVTVREEIACRRDLSEEHLTALLGDASGAVRARVVGRAWPHLDAAARAALPADRHSGVRAEAVLARYAVEPLGVEEFGALTVGLEEGDRLRIVGTCLLTGELAVTLTRAEPAVRRALAANPRLDADLVAVLAQDGEQAVRFEVSLRPELDEAERAGIVVGLDLDPSGWYAPPSWVSERRRDAAEMRRCAASTHPVLRRSVAQVRELPSDVVEVLARDEDFVVRLLLAENCVQAPAELLLEMWARGIRRVRDHPNFPRVGLLRFADDPDPQLRWLAPDDPAASDDLVERCAGDEGAGVRARALENPRLSVGSVQRLLDDEDPWVRCRARRDPRVPAAVLAGLLADVRTAEEAARNPAVPAAVLRHLLEPPVVVDAVIVGAG